MARGAPPPPGPPRLLQRLYGAGNVLPLGDLLLQLSASPRGTAALRDTLVQHFDHTDYSDALLARTFCVVRPGAPPLSAAASLRQAASQLLHRAIEALLQAPQGKHNVLCYGYRKKRPTATGGRALVGTAGTEAYHANSVTDSLLAPPWKLLLSRIGDTMMLYLLLHVSMFSCLGNDTCLQLAGPSAVAAARTWKRAAAVPQLAEDVGFRFQGAGRAGPDAERPPNGAQEKPAEGRGGPGTQEPFSGQSSRGPAQQAQQDAEAMEVDEPKARRRRPSSWQRRKARAAAEAASAAAAARGGSLSADTPLDEDIPPTQPLEEMDDAPQEAAAPSASPLPGDVCSYTQWPRYMLKPSEMVINRVPVFYASSFPSKPGFPAKHVLKAIHGREDAGHVLYSAIFDPKASPVGRAASLYQSRHLTLPRPPHRVPARHAHLLPVLQSIVHRAAKCPFGKLLNLYCPLPRHMRREPPGATAAAAGGAGWAAEPRPLVADGEKDLDILMDELYEMEQAQHAQQEQGGDGPGVAVPPPHAAAPAHGHRRRAKLTGLGQLVLEAESQLDPAIAMGSGPHGADAIAGGSGGGGGQRTQVSKPSSMAHGGHSQGLVHGALRAQPPEAAAPSAPAGAAAAPPAPDQPPSVESLATCFVPHGQVTGFLWAAVRRIVPRPLLGGGRCRRALRRSLAAFVSLRRYEQMGVHQLLQRQELSGHSWLSPPTVPGAAPRTTPPSAAAARQRALALWLGWLFSAVLVPLLRAHFFVTESEAYRQQVFYYRKPVWRRLAAAATDALAGTQFAPLPAAKVREILERRRLGVARLRLLPKRVGMRCIVNMGAKTTVRFKAARRGAAPVAALTGPGAKLPREEDDTVLTFPSINSQISGIHQILKLEASRQPGVLGASTFAYDDVYCRLLPYVRSWKAAVAAETAATASVARTGAPSGGGGAPAAPGPALRPYLVSVDVSRAFDHVDVATLLDLVTPLFRSEQYLVLKYTELVAHMGDIKVVPRRLAVSADGGGNGGDAPEAFPSRATAWAATRKGKLYVDGVVYERISRSDALRTLRQHLTANLVRLRRTWHYQCRGIAQGGTLSTLLCSLYLAHVERSCLAPVVAAAAPAAGPRRAVSSAAFSVGAAITGPPGSATTSSRGGLTALAAAAPPPSLQRGAGSDLAPAPPALARRMREHTLLLRLVDDWLLITAHLAVAQAAARAMLGGIPAYNVAVNPAKTKLSFTLTGLPGAGGGGGGGGTIEPALYVAGDGARFIKWCGLLLNADSLEVQGDYTRYAGEHIATSMTLPPKRALGAALPSKLCVYLRPKVHPLLLDPSINSFSTIRLNIYQAFAIGAMKFHCYVRAMAAPPAPGSTLLLAAIETGIAFMVKITRPRRVGPTLGSAAGRALSCDPGVCPAHVRFLGLHAFRRVLRRKAARYGELLAAIDKELAAPWCARCAAALAPAVDVGRSTVLDAIIY